MKNLTDKEKVYYEKHLRQDIAAEFEEEKDSGNQPENPGRYHFTKIIIIQYRQEKDNC